jgi:hypothetical protein
MEISSSIILHSVACECDSVHGGAASIMNKINKTNQLPSSKSFKRATNEHPNQLANGTKEGFGAIGWNIYLNKKAYWEIITLDWATKSGGQCWIIIVVGEGLRLRKLSTSTLHAGKSLLDFVAI